MKPKNLILYAAFAALMLILDGTSIKAADISIRLLAFQTNDAIGEVYVHDPAAEKDAPPVKTRIKSYLNHEFSVISLKGRNLLITTGSAPDSESLGSFAVPADSRSLMLLFLPTGNGNGERFRILPIDDSPEKFPSGSFRVLNFSDVPVRLMLEKKGYEIASGKSELITDPPARTGNLTGMNAYVLLQEDEWKRIGSGVWPLPGQNRVLQILFREPNSGIVQLRAFDDVPPRER
jgi:hypothetical protein